MKLDNQHWEKLRVYAYKLAVGYNLPPHTSAEDVAQEAMVSLLKALPEYRESRGPLIAFSRAVVRNAVTDAVRRAYRKFGNGFDSLEECGPKEEPSDDWEKDADNKVIVDQLLSALPPNRRVVMEMAYLKEMSRIEIAEILGVTPQAIGLIIKKSLKELRELVK